AGEATWAEKWLAAEEAIYGQGRPGTVAALMALAEARRLAGRFDEGLQMTERALAIVEGAVGHGDAQAGQILQQLASMMLQARRTDEGLADARRALAIAVATDVPPGMMTLQAHHTLGQLLDQAGQHRQALEHLAAAVAVGEKALEPDDTNLA